MSSSIPNTNPASHAETSPLLGEKIVDSNGIQARIQARDPRKRFFRAFSIATILYVLLQVLAIGCVVKFYLAYRPFSSKSSMRRPQDDGDNYDCSLDWSDKDTAHTTPSPWTDDVDFQNWPDREYSAFASFDLPTSAPLLYFLSSGHLIAGSVTYDTTSRHTDKIQVDVEMRYRTEEGRDRTEVCVLSKNDGSSGVGIYGHGDIHDSPRHDLFVKFYVTVKFPGTFANPLKLKDLETNMSLFGQNFGKLEGSVSFDTVSVETSNTPIAVGSLFAKNIEMSDQNTPITGHFNVTESLTLSTSNAHINVDANLSNKDDESRTRVVLSTSNAAIGANVNLYSANGKKGGHFEIHATTSNAPLDVSIPVSPSKPHLILAAATKNSRATIKLPLEYEGSITASTSWSPVILDIDTKAKDPSGNDLQRHLQIIKSTGTSTFANLWWGDDEDRKELGKVDVSTSLAKVTVEA